jgi:hypothetical protein
MVRVIKSRRMRRAGHVACMGEMRNACNILVGNPERNRLLGRPRRRWTNNVRIDLTDIGWAVANWLHLAQDRDNWQALSNSGMSFRFS